MTRTILTSLLLGLMVSSCATVSKDQGIWRRANTPRPAQVYLEDSSAVFFDEYPNPFYDRQFLTFWCYLEGDVQLVVHDAVSDTLVARYAFEKQKQYLYHLAMQWGDYRHRVWCTVRVNGRDKCRKEFIAFTPLPDKQPKETRYILLPR